MTEVRPKPTENAYVRRLSDYCSGEAELTKGIRVCRPNWQAWHKSYVRLEQTTLESLDSLKIVLTPG
jgi:deoxyribodipyrimidine photolyase-like uncharacterized protein